MGRLDHPEVTRLVFRFVIFAICINKNLPQFFYRRSISISRATENSCGWLKCISPREADEIQNSFILRQARRILRHATPLLGAIRYNLKFRVFYLLLGKEEKMNSTQNIAVLVGSLRKGSLCRKVANEYLAHAPEGLNFRMIEIGHLPFYNEDDEAQPPTTWKNFRQQIDGCDGLLFITPEYNRSVPGVLKNALDVGSRPYGKSVWQRKPAAIISLSKGALGAFGANHHLRQILVGLGVPTMAEPEAYIGAADGLFDQAGHLINPETLKFLGGFMEAFSKWIIANKSTKDGSH